MARGAAVLAVGRVRRPHGVNGEVVVEVLTDFPGRMAPGVEVGLGVEEPERWVRVHRVRWHKGCWLLAFDALASRDEVEELRRQWVFLPEQQRSELPERYYYEHELVGLSCCDIAGRPLGRVKALVGGGAGALLEVETERGDILVPFLSPIVVEVDLVAETVVLDPPRGLFDDDAL
jgi:16S rRNA processing protein RimM